KVASSAALPKIVALFALTFKARLGDVQIKPRKLSACDHGQHERSRSKLRDQRGDTFERFVQTRSVAASGLREVRAPTARSADDRRNLLYDITGFDSAGQVGCDRDQDCHLVVD